jgi:hypothetical protein
LLAVYCWFGVEVFALAVCRLWAVDIWQIEIPDRG